MTLRPPRPLRVRASRASRLKQARRAAARSSTPPTPPTARAAGARSRSLIRLPPGLRHGVSLRRPVARPFALAGRPFDAHARGLRPVGLPAEETREAAERRGEDADDDVLFLPLAGRRRRRGGAAVGATTCVSPPRASPVSAPGAAKLTARGSLTSAAVTFMAENIAVPPKASAQAQAVAISFDARMGKLLG